MAEGVRLAHPTERNCVLTIRIPQRAHAEPFYCPICERNHEVKTYHLQLNDQGSTIVSQTVYARLEEVGLGGMIVVGAVAEPPPIRVGMKAERERVPVVSTEELGNEPTGS